MEEEELVRRLKSGDKSAFSYLYDHYSGALYGVIIRVLHNREMADEVLQDAFLRIWNKIDRYETGRSRLFTWMLNITRNLAIDKTRSKEYSQFRKTGNMDEIVHIDERSLTTEQSTEGIGVDQVVNELEENKRIVIEYLYFRGFTQAELSEELKIPLGTIKSRLRAAMKELRKKFGLT